MAATGPKPKPHLAAVREGTFRADRNKAGARFAPVDPVEPDWEEIFPAPSRGVLAKEAKEIRSKAAEVWARVVPALIVSAGLTDPQRETITDYCITAARIWQGERELSRTGLVVPTERGMVKSPWTSILNAYRAHFRSLTGELGLSPSSAARLTPPEDGDDDGDIFD
ncbi:P27 family phage terminase small subunit [Streptomyces sp. NPDC006540]|uniref:P27 family phage terminase small subunit n=1 Tax=Streptomyces sp. NPDC006540 TaxID=3155353 RepID=UPI0033AA6F6D